MLGTLLLSAAAAAIAGLIFAYVGHRLGQRVVTTPEAKAALTCFRVWWYGVAVTAFVGAMRLSLYMAGALPPWLYQATSQVTIMVACLALWALLCYLVYLYTGRLKSWTRLAVLYLFVTALFVGLVAWLGEPRAVADDGWTLKPQYVHPLPGWGSLLVLLALVGPQLVAAFAYLRLLKHAQDRTTRYRIRMVAGSLSAWFGATILANFLGLQGASGELLTRGISILAALLVLFAYDPPRPIRDRLGVVRAGEEEPVQVGAKDGPFPN